MKCNSRTLTTGICLLGACLIAQTGQTATPKRHYHKTHKHTATSLTANVITGAATWYPSTGKATASGQPYDTAAMTCAMWITNSLGHPLRPDGRIVSVLNVETGKKVQVAWTDNGPGIVPRSRGVVIDLTPAAMIALAGQDGIKRGKIKVKVERI